MDPLSITAGIIGVIDGSIRLSKILKQVTRLSGVTKDDSQAVELYEDISMYKAMLEHSAKTSLALQGNVPQAAEDCIRLCHRRLELLSFLSSKYVEGRKKPKPSSTTPSSDLRRASKGFARSVKLLRDILAE